MICSPRFKSFVFKKYFSCIESLCEPGENKFASVGKMAVDRSAAFRTTMNKHEWYLSGFENEQRGFMECTINFTDK